MDAREKGFEPVEDTYDEHPRLSSRAHKRQHSLRKATPSEPLPILSRVSLAAVILVASVILVTHLHSSPWLSSNPALFLRPPPPLNLLSELVPPVHGCQDLSVTTLEPREKAAIVLLVREQDLEELLPTLRNFEHRFNRNFRYPYVFLSSPDNPEFSLPFRDSIMKVLPTDAVVEWGEVPLEHWSIPRSMDVDKVRKGFAEQEANGVMYAGREGYHHMCRFYSGFWARHPLLAKYDWYWRLEPGVGYFCSITYDPFRFMATHNKVYGFVITVAEAPNTIPTLFSTLTTHARQRNITPNPAMWHFLTKKNKEGEEEYSACHFWTNMEIGDLRFFRSEAYQSIFNALDQAGGFFTERWGDAPVRSIALGLLVDVDRIHFFEDFAYKHDYFMHCPKKQGLGCDCACPSISKTAVDIDTDYWHSCLPRWKEATETLSRFN